MKAKKAVSYEVRKRKVGVFFVLPFIIGAIVFFIRPLIESVIMSMSVIRTDRITGSAYEFVGFKHFIDAFTKDPTFLREVVESLKSLVYTVPIILILSLFIAIILNQEFKGRFLVRGMFFLPVIIASGVVLSIINGDALSGVMMSGSGASKVFQNEFLRNFMLENGFSESMVSWFTGLADNIFNLLWKCGVQILIFLSGLQMISQSMYEAAQIEGATWWETFWKITFPVISPVTLLNLIYTIVDIFTDYSNPVMSHISKTATGVSLNLPLSTAMAWSYFLMVGVILVIVYAVINRKVFYET